MKIEQVIDKLEDFPTLPTIYTQLMDVLSNPRSTVQDVADVIIMDQASTTKVLKVVNSPLFALKTKVLNVSQAIFYIGFNEVKNIILALSVMDIFAKMSGMAAFNITNLWKHSIAVGVINKLLGTKLGESNTEDYFVSGIIHDIGVLFLINALGEQYRSVVTNAIENNTSLSRAERVVFGFDHHQVGELVAEKWDLPDQIKNVIRHQYVGTLNSKPDKMVACVHLANIMAIIMNLNYQLDSRIPQPNFEIWNVLKFEKGDLMGLQRPILNAYNESVSILQLKK